MEVKSSLFKTVMIIMGTITILGVAALIFVLNLDSSEADGERSIDEIREASLLTEEITTDLKDGHFVRISFRIVTDSKSALEELEKRDFQMKNILIKELAAMEGEAFQGGLSELEKVIKLKLNELMNEGQITEVYTVDKVLQ
ncbi:flagellar basal body-associated protein FliL [Halobacillus shinanisalinarum]|uniref:Flagellar protein FliL n=1 Tax=Halobacillus shinanisalinarum TaxID=2932258 RepID=A0ABY4H0Q7_9BACI|nr:flagellar basal body-associated protein FliL [Halobacillus shinanisalinarum]UOQ93227.1 flagellar basal body-associated protein FliL [Halobacillus shinanisalinarum]